MVALVLLMLPRATAETGKVAVIIPSYPEILFWSDIENAIRRKAEELNLELLPLYTRHSEANLALGLNDALEIALYADADAVIASYTLADERTDTILRAAREKGVPVIMIDCDCPEDLRTAYIGINNLDAGKEMGALALSAMGEGEKALLIYSASSPEHVNLRERIEGVHEAFRGKKDCLEDVRLANINIQAVLDVRRRLDADPSIQALIAINENSTLLCAQVLNAAGNSAGIKLYGFDESADTLALLNSGVIEALACQTHGIMGEKSVETARSIMAGDPDAAGIHLIKFEIHRHPQ